MAAKDHYNWGQIYKQARQLIETGTPANYSALADKLHLDVNSLKRGIQKVLGYKPTSLNDLPPMEENQPIAEENGNYLEVRSNAPAVFTLKQLLKVGQVDLKTWRVREHMLNQWQGFFGEGNIVPLWQVKAWLVRKDIRPIEPTLCVLEITLPNLTPQPPSPRGRGSRVKRDLIIADPQVGFRRRLYGDGFEPFHDRRVLDIALQIAQAERFDGIRLIGDAADMSAWSLKYTPEPTFWHTTQPALLELAWWLAQLRMAQPEAEMDLFEGNHEVRPETAIVSHMREAYKLKAVDELHLPPALSVPRLLSLHTLNVNYIAGYPDNWKWLNQNVMLRHGDVVRGTPGGTAAAVINKSTYTTVFGHVHRREMVARLIQTANGHAVQTAFCPGCACHIDGRVPGSKADDNWQQGLGILEYTEGDVEPNIIQIAVDRGQAIHNGKVWKARERDKEIDKMLKGKLDEIMAAEGVR